MPANLTSADVTITMTAADRYFLPAPLTLVSAVVGFGAGDSSLTYPTNGVPLPDKAFGLNKGIRFAPMAFASGYVITYDATYNTLRIFKGASGANPMAELAGNAAVPVLSIPMVVFGE